MWLDLNLDDMIFKFQITNYKSMPSLNEEWCKISFNIQFDTIIQYQTVNNELILYYELEDIRDYLGDLINNKLEKQEIIQCIEPDFSFIFKPYNQPKPTEIDYSNSILGKSLELRIHLLNHSRTPSYNYFPILFDEEQMIFLYNYLLLVTNKITKNDPKIIDMMNKGLLHE